MDRVRRIEREFGVPFPGEIVSADRHTRTGLKRLPSGGVIEWEPLFGRRAPVVVDLGCGNGRYLIGSAVWRPELDHFGLDVLPLVIRYATRRANQRGLTNIRFAVGDAAWVLEHGIAPGTVREIHVYHPQPYQNPREARRRLVTPRFVALAHRVLEPGGELFLQTDNEPYWRYMTSIAVPFFEFTSREGLWPDAPKGRTRREILALRRGLPVFRGVGTVRSMEQGEAIKLASRLPLPLFDAGQANPDLDSLEQRLE
jgi:tRNA (guanine-N7-)-methyltransferase